MSTPTQTKSAAIHIDYCWSFCVARGHRLTDCDCPCHEIEKGAPGADLLIPILPHIVAMQPPVNVDPEVCICGDVECSGVCEFALWAVNQVLSHLDATGDVDLIAETLDVNLPSDSSGAGQ